MCVKQEQYAQYLACFKNCDNLSFTIVFLLSHNIGRLIEPNINMTLYRACSCIELLTHWLLWGIVVTLNVWIIMSFQRLISFLVKFFACDVKCWIISNIKLLNGSMSNYWTPYYVTQGQWVKSIDWLQTGYARWWWNNDFPMKKVREPFIHVLTIAIQTKSLGQLICPEASVLSSNCHPVQD